MPMDGTFIHYLTNELNNELQLSKINKIYMPQSSDIIIELRTKERKNVNLLLSSNLSNPRIHLTTHSYQAPNIPLNFCMILRKYIERGYIKEIVQLGNDRVIKLNIISSNELGDTVSYSLIIELMGRNSNIILTEDNVIIDAVRRLFPISEDTRTIIPKAIYISPERLDQVNPFTSDITSLDNLCGVSTKLKRYLQNFTDIKEALNQDITPVIFKQDNKLDFYAYPITQDEIVGKFDTLSSLLDNFYKEQNNSNDSITHSISKQLEKRIKQLKHKISLLNDDLDESENIILNENDAILLQSNLYKIRKGDSKVIVEDYFNNGELKEISLNPLLEPSINLKKMFTKIKKAKTSIKYLNEQIELCKEEIDYLDNIIFQLSIATLEEISEIRQELMLNGYLKKQQKFIKNKKMSKPLTFIVDDVEILVGKYNTQNEYLTHHVARSSDVWFHAKDIPGSHVIVRTNFSNLTENIIRTAANIAAFYSKSSHSSSVPVDYTEIKNIKKINGEKGYHVTYRNQHTIYIDPEESLFIKYKQ